MFASCSLCIFIKVSLCEDNVAQISRESRLENALWNCCWLRNLPLIYKKYIIINNITNIINPHKAVHFVSSRSSVCTCSSFSRCTEVVMQDQEVHMQQETAEYCSETGTFELCALNYKTFV